MLNNNNESDIFLDQKYEVQMSIDYYKGKNIIPNNATTQRNIEKAKIMIEWRWRIFKIDGKEYIEISQKNGNNRLFLNSKGNWIKRSSPKNYNNDVQEVVYAYMN